MELIKGEFHWANSKHLSVARAGSTWELNPEAQMDEFICYESFAVLTGLHFILWDGTQGCIQRADLGALDSNTSFL